MRCLHATSSWHQVEADPAGGVVVLALVECEEEGDMVSLAYLWRQTPIETPVTSRKLTKEMNLLKISYWTLKLYIYVITIQLLKKTSKSMCRFGGLLSTVPMALGSPRLPG